MPIISCLTYIVNPVVEVDKVILKKFFVCHVGEVIPHDSTTYGKCLSFFEPLFFLFNGNSVKTGNTRQ